MEDETFAKGDLVPHGSWNANQNIGVDNKANECF
jgi:hypothetical protein